MLKLTQYADDTTTILDGTTNSLQATLNILEIYGSLSVLNVNCDKTKLIWIGSKKDSKEKLNLTSKLHWGDSQFTLLGLEISTNLSNIPQINYSKAILKAKRVLNSWRFRYLTPFGKITILKTLILSQFNHLFTSVVIEKKFKSKRGGNVDCMVKNKIAWPQDTVLGGPSHQRVTYDQLSLTQWVQGFARNMIEENCQETREQMLLYLADIMSDATDFSWQNAKAAHAVLLCDMERGAVTWKDTSKIDRIRRAHAQKHSQNSKSWVKNSDVMTGKKPWFCKPFQTGTCTFSRDHESNGKWQKHICAT